MMRRREDVGETLVEVMLTIVIIGLTVGALLSSLGTVAKAANAQRSDVQADVVMRNYAEATKAKVQTSCPAGVSYTVVYPVSLPAGFQTPTGADGLCPSITAPKLLTLKVVDPLGVQTTMQIKVAIP